MQPKLVVLIAIVLSLLACGQHADAKKEGYMQLKYISLIVEDQEKALNFYTSVLGFEKVADVPAGEYRWLTVAPPRGKERVDFFGTGRKTNSVPPRGEESVELLLEPDAFPPAKIYQKALFDAGIPATLFVTRDVDAEFNRLKSLGVEFHTEPTEAGNVKLIIFEDTCGNLIQLIQHV